MRTEIYAGLRNALERGESLEKAMRSFTNAGYNPAEVKAAGDMFSGGASEIIYSEPPAEKTDGTRGSVPTLSAPENRQSPLQFRKRSSFSGKRLALLIAILVVLIVFVGGVGYLIYTLVK